MKYPTLDAFNRKVYAIPYSEVILECTSLILHPDYSKKVKCFCAMLLDRIQLRSGRTPRLFHIYRTS